MAALLRELGLKPVVVAGHSAGAAIAVRMTLDRSITPVAVVSLNGALLPFRGVANDLFGPAARFLASSTMTAGHLLSLPGLARRWNGWCDPPDRTSTRRA